MIRWEITAAGGRRFLLALAFWNALFTSGIVFGQANALGGTGWEAQYNFELNLGLSRKFNARLLVSENRSMFFWGNPVEVANEPTAADFHLTIDGRDSIGSYTYTDRDTGQMISVMPPLAGRDVRVCEDLPQIPWKLTGNQRTIGPYHCEEASAIFRGRTYYVWFAPELPAPFGPWKLQGLPGLIVYAYDESREIVFSLERLRSSVEAINTPVPRADCMDLKTFEDFQQEWAQDLIRRMNAKLPRGSHMELGKQNTMERFEH